MFKFKKNKERKNIIPNDVVKFEKKFNGIVIFIIKFNNTDNEKLWFELDKKSIKFSSAIFFWISKILRGSPKIEKLIIKKKIKIGNE